MSTILEINNLVKLYRQVRALDGVTLSIKKGEIFCLLGVNGEGKTTLSSILATLHPPTSGDILYNGISIYNNLAGYRNALGFCPQRQNLDLLLNVQENLMFAGRYYLMDQKTINQRVSQLMQQLELTRYATFNIDQLSGGTKQRVLIARALMHSPEIVILDEPTVGLDPDIRRKLWDQILELKKQGITVILTTHYLDEAEVLSDRVCVLNRGKVLLIETAAHLKAKHQKVNLEEVFLHLMQQEAHGT